MEGQFDAPGSGIKPGTRFGALTFLTWFVNSRHKNHLVFGWRCDTEYYADLYNNLLILATTVRQTHCSKLQPADTQPAEVTAASCRRAPLEYDDTPHTAATIRYYKARNVGDYYWLLNRTNSLCLHFFFKLNLAQVSHIFAFYHVDQMFTDIAGMVANSFQRTGNP